MKPPLAPFVSGGGRGRSSVALGEQSQMNLAKCCATVARIKLGLSRVRPALFGQRDG